MCIKRLYFEDLVLHQLTQTTAIGPPDGRANESEAARAVHELRIANASPSIVHFENCRSKDCSWPSWASRSASASTMPSFMISDTHNRNVTGYRNKHTCAVRVYIRPKEEPSPKRRNHVVFGWSFPQRQGVGKSERLWSAQEISRLSPCSIHRLCEYADSRHISQERRYGL